MKRAILGNLSLLNTPKLLLTSPQSKTNSSLAFFVASTRSRLRFYSSDSNSSSKPNYNQTQKKALDSPDDDADVVSDQELKKRVEKYYEGDEDEIPAIFEAILKRKLAGISDDDSLMESLGQKVKDDEEDDFDELHDSDSVSDSDDDKGR